MLLYTKHLLSVFLLITLCASCTQYDEKIIMPYEYPTAKVGDSLVWAQPTYDDSNWSNEFNLDSYRDTFWIRMRVLLPERTQEYKNMGISHFGVGSYEIYWDGYKIGQNGRLASHNAREEYGDYKTIFHLPDTLVEAGEHLIGLRTTMSREELDHHVYYMIGDYHRLATEPIQISKYMFVIGGIFITASVYFLFLFAGNTRDYSTLLFSLICLTFTAILFLEYLKLFHTYPYPFQRTRLEWIGYLHASLSFLIPWFFVRQFDIPVPWRKYLYMVLGAAILILEYKYYQMFDTLAVHQSKLMWLTSLGVILYACWQKKREAFIVLIGFLCSWLVTYFTPFFDFPYLSSYDISLFLGFNFIVLSMLYLLAYRRSKEQKAYQDSLVFSERLKNELLKKNIKPHFIMNTLTSLIDWVEESPKEGVELIHALAGEFEVLNDIADHKLIPISQEIKLCKNHLRVMGFRKEIDYRWFENDIDYNEILPPAIIHTAIENGVTHSLPDEDKQMDFILTYSKNNSFKTYTLLIKAPTKTNVTPTSNHKDHEGTGTRYIKARLQESYGDKWEYLSEPHDDGWLHTFKLPRQ